MPRSPNLPPYPNAFRPPNWDERMYPEIAGVSFAKKDTTRGFLYEGGLQVYSQWAQLGFNGDPNLPYPNTPESFKETKIFQTPVTEQARLYVVDIRGYELTTIVPNGQVKGPAKPASIPLDGQFSRLRLKLSWGRSSGGSTRTIDIAEGIRVGLEVPFLTAFVQYPATGTTVAVTGTNFETRNDQETRRATMQLTNCVALDSLIGVACYESTSVPGQRQGTLTRTLLIPEPPEGSEGGLPPILGVNAIEVPSGVVSVSIYQGPEGQPADLEWTQTGPPLFYPPLGQIILDPQRRAENIPRPAGARIIRVTNLDVTNFRIITFVFNLEI